MFSNVALDVVIGLVFVYLLYSLFATILAEIIATQIGLRAYNLKEAVDRMLNDEDRKESWITRLKDSLNLVKNPDNLQVKNFYNHPEIKYLGSTGIFKTPSSFKAVSFSKTVLYCLGNDGVISQPMIQSKLLALSNDPTNVPLQDRILGKQTARYVLSLWLESYGDMEKFKLQLETWFDRTMEQSTEWYKRKIRWILMILGFLLAWLFNADSFEIIGKLSGDRDAREKMVQLASAYIANNTSRPQESSPSFTEEKLDSLLAVKKMLDKDIENANTILGTGAWPADTIYLTIDKKSGAKVYRPQIDPLALSKAHQQVAEGKIPMATCNKCAYFFRLIRHHFFGYLITAIAISLGAPFWYDLLNKLMKLRTAPKQETDSTEGKVNSNVSRLDREA